MSLSIAYKKGPEKPLTLREMQARQRTVAMFRFTKLAILILTPGVAYFSHLSSGQAVGHMAVGFIFFAFMHYGQCQAREEIAKYNKEN
jgi:hypothetical protein